MPSHATSAFAPGATLQSHLDAITERTRTLVQPERLAVTEAAIAGLLASGIEETILPVGAPAPSFTLPTAHATALTDFAAPNARLVRSEDLLALGPLVLLFFRGRWDPYCMTTLEAWQHTWSTLRTARSRSATPDSKRLPLTVGITPQLPRQNDFTAQQHSLTFPLLSDSGCKLAAQFHLAYTLSPTLQQQLRSTLVNLPFINGDDSWQLPLAATYVIDQSGIIRYANASADHRVRPDPADVLRVLD